MLALSSITVSNHIGKKYMIEKLQRATRKFEIDMMTASLCFKRNGTIMGSGTTYNSTNIKRRTETPDTTREEMTLRSDH